MTLGDLFDAVEKELGMGRLALLKEADHIELHIFENGICYATELVLVEATDSKFVIDVRVGGRLH